MSIAILQMVSGPAVTANLRAAERLLERAAEAGARLAVLPENFVAIGHPAPAELARAEALGQGEILPWLSSRARELGLWLLAGTLPLLPDGVTEGKPCACSLLYDDQGRRVARYDKLHLFDADVSDSQGSYRESDHYAAGETLTVVDTPVGRLGLSVCYDLRFPELYGALRAAGAELISAPSAFTVPTGQAHWELLLRARAVETQSYLLGAAQGGVHANGRSTWGHAMAVDPWGEVLAVQASGEAVLLIERDAERQAALRQRMPVTRHRRFLPARLAERQ